MLQLNTGLDSTTERLLALNIKLTQALFESGIMRIRLLKARNDNVWPDMGRATRLFVEAQPPSRVSPLIRPLS